MRREPQQTLALGKGLIDETEFSMLEIAQAAVDQTRRRSGRTGCGIVTLYDVHAQALQHRLARDCSTVDSGTDDDQVVVHRLRRHEPLAPRQPGRV